MNLSTPLTKGDLLMTVRLGHLVSWINGIHTLRREAKVSNWKSVSKSTAFGSYVHTFAVALSIYANVSLSLRRISSKHHVPTKMFVSLMSR